MVGKKGRSGRKIKFEDEYHTTMRERQRLYYKRKEQKETQIIMNKISPIPKPVLKPALELTFPIPKNEQGVVFLFSRYYELLGFDKIKRIQRGFPDCIAIKNNKEVRIEFEFLSSSFNHDTQGCDLVICWECNKSLEVPILELMPLLTLQKTIHQKIKKHKEKEGKVIEE